MNNNNFKKVISAAELVKLRWRPHGWLLWQMVPQGGITLLAGETASGKSLLGLDLALGLAAGRGRAWDMELGEPIADSSWLIADREKTNDREKTADSSWLIADSEKTPAACPGSEAERVPSEADSVQNDAHLMRKGTSHIPYREKNTAPSSLIPACPVSEADRDLNEANREKIAYSSWLIADSEKTAVDHPCTERTPADRPCRERTPCQDHDCLHFV